MQVSLADGAVSSDARIWGCHLPNLFNNEAFRRAWLASLGWKPRPTSLHVIEDTESVFERLAHEVAASLDLDLLDALIRKQA